MKTRLQTGDTAPDFELFDINSNKFQLSSLRGQKVIVFFYPSAETPGCTIEACDFRDNEHVFKSFGYQVVGISSDQMIKVKYWAEKRGLLYKLVVDPEKEVHRNYGITRWSSPLSMISGGRSRSTFVIDENGKIEVALYNVQAFGHVKRLLNLLKPELASV